jgi:NAD(P)H-flavin reductase
LTRACEAPASWHRGRILGWLADEFADFSAWHVLAAGPPAFVYAGVARAQALGAAPDRILTDSFTPTIP